MLRIAGSGGIGEGERPYRLLLVKAVGEPGAFELNEDLLLEPSIGGGGTAKAGVLATDKAGVRGAPPEVEV
jgi:hypothetical protein